MASFRRLAACVGVLLALAGCSNSGVPDPSIHKCAATPNGGCDSNATCDDSTGAVQCTCIPGYKGDGMTCKQITPCDTNFGGCDPNATCMANGAFPACACNSGYTGDGFHCEKARSCAESNGGCDQNATCGQSGDIVTCTCNHGYTGDGYTCAELPNCAKNNGGCDANASCADPLDDGNVICTCNTGYMGDGRTCTDVNECMTQPGPCDVNATCANTVGSYTCTCKTGYMGDGKTCMDVDECATKTDKCNANALCTNTIGSYTCACKDGFSGDGVVCTPDNGCVLNNGGCDTNATCTLDPNAPEGRTCSCNDGYGGNGYTCTKVQLCSVNNGGCDKNATCDNPTSHERTCTCNQGYTGNGLTCTDVNECAMSPSPCDANATCTNTPGSYTCACKTGWTGDGVTCQDVDECQMMTDKCDKNASCTNTPGSYTCQCNSGWTNPPNTPTSQLGFLCVDVNECTNHTNNCDPNATCTNTPGSFTCACNTPAFTGDGTSCQSHYTQVAVGDRHLCAIRADGLMFCWGNNTLGQAGIGTLNSQALSVPTLPVSIGATAPKWASVAAGSDVSCGIALPSGNLYCWGYNGSGQLGTGDMNNYAIPQLIGGPNATWSQVASNHDHTCGIQQNGTLLCWGSNTYNQLGIGNIASSTSPYPASVPMGTAFQSLGTGIYHGCALNPNGGTIWCWGANASGQVGQAMSVSQETKPTPISTKPVSMMGPNGAWASLAIGSQSDCAILQTDGSLWCWGANSRGQLGNNTTTTTYSPSTSFVSVQVKSGASSWDAVAVGDAHACAIDSGGTVYCWGDNQYKQLGDGSIVGYRTTPVAVSLPAGSSVTFKSIAAANNLTCAIDSNNQLWCWGAQPMPSMTSDFPFGATPTLVTK